MNVLSLFNGMSFGRMALDTLNIPVGKYYSSEIDKYAIQAAQALYPSTIQLGDVIKWREWDIDLSSIDLLLAGFPCQAWSMAGKQQGDNDPRGALVHDLIDIWAEIKKVNPNLKFMFENVKMKKEFLDYINELFGVEPICINSALVSAQNRVRYYWTNIEGVDQPEDKSVLGVNFDGDYVEKSKKLNREFTAKRSKGSLDLRGYYGGNSNSQRVYGLNGKMPTLLVNNTGGNNPLWITTDGLTAYSASFEFCCFLQTVPKNYICTLIGSGVTKDKLYKLLGNGWTHDVIVHIFKGLK